MEEHKEISRIEDIKLLVDTFYSRVREDKLLGPVFENQIKDQWEKHLETMYRFWQTLLLEDHTYYGSPFLKHMNLPIHAEHFDRWLTLFHQTVDDYFKGDGAEDAKWRASRMADMFLSKLNYMRERNRKPLM